MIGLILWWLWCLLAFVGIAALIIGVSLWMVYRDMALQEKDVNQDF